MLATTLTIALSTAAPTTTQPPLVLLPQFREPQPTFLMYAPAPPAPTTTPRPAMHTLYWNAPDNTLYRAQDLPNPLDQYTYADADWFADDATTAPLVGPPAP